MKKNSEKHCGSCKKQKVEKIQIVEKYMELMEQNIKWKKIQSEKNSEKN